MSHYRRAVQAGGSSFFTVVTYRRRPWLIYDVARAALREAITRTREKHPFSIDAWVLMPDHLHCIWTLPPSDSDFATRWSLIKRRVSMALGQTLHVEAWMSASEPGRVGTVCPRVQDAFHAATMYAQCRVGSPSPPYEEGRG